MEFVPGRALSCLIAASAKAKMACSHFGSRLRKARKVIDFVAMSEQDSGMATRVNEKLVPAGVDEASPSKSSPKSSS